MSFITPPVTFSFVTELGMCNLRIFDYKERQSAPQSPTVSKEMDVDEIVDKIVDKIDMSEFIKRDELESLVNNMLGGIN